MSSKSPLTADEADLKANRAGYLSDKQRPMLKQRIRYLRLIHLGNSALFVIIALPCSLSTLSIALTSPNVPLQPLTILLYAILGVLILALVWRMRRETSKVSADLADGRVAAHSGPVEFVVYRAMRLGGELFPLPVSTLKVEWNGTYTVYYAPRSRLIVAMEKR